MGAGAAVGRCLLVLALASVLLVGCGEIIGTWSEPERPDPLGAAVQRELVRSHLQETVEQLATFWSHAYRAMGVPVSPSVRTVFTRPGEVAAHACRGADRTDPYGAFYCPADDTIYISLEHERSLVFGADTTARTPQSEVGWFPVEWVIAHEYAHNVQVELRLPFEAVVKPAELQADCFAGVFTAWREEFHTGTFTVEHINQALTVMAMSGDYELDHPQHHGTPIERQSGFVAGWRAGQPAECVRMNPWPGGTSE